MSYKQYQLTVTLLLIIGIFIYYKLLYATKVDLDRHFHGAVNGTIEVGDCVTHTSTLESWEDVIIYRLLEKGHASYRVCVYLDSGCNINSTSSWGFNVIDAYFEEVQCPSN